MPCCGAEPAGAPAILTQRAARGESGRLWRRSSRACRRRLMSGKLSLPSGKVFSQEAERRGLARLAAGATNLSVPKLKKNDTNKDYDTWGTQIGGLNSTTRTKTPYLPTYPQPGRAASSEAKKDENRGYLPVAGPSGAVKAGPTYLLHRVSPW